MTKKKFPSIYFASLRLLMQHAEQSPRDCQRTLMMSSLIMKGTEVVNVIRLNMSSQKQCRLLYKPLLYIQSYRDLYDFSKNEMHSVRCLVSIIL